MLKFFLPPSAARRGGGGFGHGGGGRVLGVPGGGRACGNTRPRTCVVGRKEKKLAGNGLCDFVTGYCKASKKYLLLSPPHAHIRIEKGGK